MIHSRKPKEAKKTSTTRALFIIDPSALNPDDLRNLSMEEAIEYVSSRKMSTVERIEELFSTHPNIIRRLNTLKKLEK